MIIVSAVEINRPVDDVWRAVAERFDKAHEWMGFVENSYKVDEEVNIEGAPMAGRVCEFTKEPNGLKAEERILRFSEQKREFDFDVVPVNAPKLFPVKKNVVTLAVKKLSGGRAEVIWQSNIELTKFGYVTYPFIKFGLSKNFNGIMEDLKEYMESHKDRLAA